MRALCYRLLTFALLALIAAPALMPLKSAGQSPASTFFDSSIPVDGVRLWVCSNDATAPVEIARTRRPGQFVIRNLPEGPWFITVDPAGCLPPAAIAGR